METRKKHRPSPKQLENMNMSKESMFPSGLSSTQVRSLSTKNNAIPQISENVQRASDCQSPSTDNSSQLYQVSGSPANQAMSDLGQSSPTKAVSSDASPEMTASAVILPTSPPETLSRSASEELEASSMNSRPLRKRQPTAKAQAIARSDKKLAKVFESQARKLDHHNSIFTPEASISPGTEPRPTHYHVSFQSNTPSDTTSNENQIPSSQCSEMSSSKWTTQLRVPDDKQLDMSQLPASKGERGSFLVRNSSEKLVESVNASIEKNTTSTNTNQHSSVSHDQRKHSGVTYIKGRRQHAEYQNRTDEPALPRQKSRRRKTKLVAHLEVAHTESEPIQSEAREGMVKSTQNLSGRRKSQRMTCEADTVAKQSIEAPQQLHPNADSLAQTNLPKQLVKSSPAQSAEIVFDDNQKVAADEKCDLSCLDPSDLLYAMAEIIATDYTDDEDDDIIDPCNHEERTQRMLRSYCRCQNEEVSRQKKGPSKLKLRVGQKSRDAESARQKRATREH